jgi:hypothetical protein
MAALAEVLKDKVLRKAFDKQRNATLDLKAIVDQRSKLGVGTYLTWQQKFLIWVFTW